MLTNLTQNVTHFAGANTGGGPGTRAVCAGVADSWTRARTVSLCPCVVTSCVVDSVPVWC